MVRYSASNDGHFSASGQQVERVCREPGPQGIAGEAGHRMASAQEIPPIVGQARALAAEAGFPLSRDESTARASASLPGVGRFLAMLAAGRADGRIAELGTGAGVGTAWIASAMPASAQLITLEIDS